MTPERPTTGTGFIEHGSPQLSNPPAAPAQSMACSPQHSTVPFVSSAQVWVLPATTVVALRRPCTGTGSSEESVLPLPSCPAALEPQHSTVPSTSRAHTWSCGLAAMAVAFFPAQVSTIDAVLPWHIAVSDVVAATVTVTAPG